MATQFVRRDVRDVSMVFVRSQRIGISKASWMTVAQVAGAATQLTDGGGIKRLVGGEAFVRS